MERTFAAFEALPAPKPCWDYSAFAWCACRRHQRSLSP